MQNSNLQKIYSASELIAWAKTNLQSNLDWCKAYVFTLDVRPEIKAELLENGFTRTQLIQLEEIGRGKWDSRLLGLSGIQYRLLEKYPLSEQRAAFDNGIEVYDSATSDIRNIPLDQLSPKQAEQAIGRTIAQQRTWLSEHQPVNSSAPGRQFIVRKKFVEVVVPFCGRLNKATLKQWLKEMGE